MDDCIKNNSINHGESEKEINDTDFSINTRNANNKTYRREGPPITSFSISSSFRLISEHSSAFLSSSATISPGKT